MLDNDLFDIQETPKNISIIFSSTMKNVDKTCDETIRFLMDSLKKMDNFKKKNSLKNGESSGGYTLNGEGSGGYILSAELKSDLFAVQLVMREGLTNAVRHGNCLNPNKIVKCSVEFTDSYLLCVSIEDQGKGFNWKKEQSTDMDETLDHGRGLIIMEQYFSRYWYNENGTKLMLEKQFIL